MPHFKLIDARTREVLASNVCAVSHTDAERFAKNQFPDRHVTASQWHNSTYAELSQAYRPPLEKALLAKKAKARKR